MSWEELAACRGVNIAVFFPGSGRNAYDTARSYCRRCPVRIHCLNDALKAESSSGARANYRNGFFGGKTPEEREEMRCQPLESNGRSANVGSPEKSVPRVAQTTGERDRELQGSPR